MNQMFSMTGDWLISFVTTITLTTVIKTQSGRKKQKKSSVNPQTTQGAVNKGKIELEVNWAAFCQI